MRAIVFLWKKKRPAAQGSGACQPNPDWPWTLTVNGISTASFDWADIVHGLDALGQDQGSFLILEQKNPENPSQYWFLQSARALAGPHVGKFIVGCGYSAPTVPGTSRGPSALLEQYHGTLKEVIPMFAEAYEGKPLDLSGFEDHSDMLPVNP